MFIYKHHCPKFFFVTAFILLGSFNSLVLAAGRNTGEKVPSYISREVQEVARFSPLTLMDCYDLALKQSETIAIQKERIKEAQARFSQSLSGIMPEATYSYSERRQDGAGNSNFTLREVPESKFVFSQPLFSGFKEFAAMAASRAEQRQFKHEKIRAQQLLFTDVSDAFYFFMNYQQDYAALSTIKTALFNRVDELKKREELGRARLSEVTSAEARLSRTEAQLEEIYSEQELARQLLEFLTGVPIKAVKDEEALDLNLIFKEQYLGKAQSRPDVLAASEAFEVAQKNIKIAQAGFWPEIGVDGNYYTKRVGNSANVDWDATLTVDVPLFKGGETVGLVKEARSQAHQVKLRYQETLRRAYLDIENAYTKFEIALKRLAAYQKAKESAG